MSPKNSSTGCWYGYGTTMRAEWNRKSSTWTFVLLHFGSTQTHTHTRVVDSIRCAQNRQATRRRYKQNVNLENRWRRLEFNKVNVCVCVQCTPYYTHTVYTLSFCGNTKIGFALWIHLWSKRETEREQRWQKFYFIFIVFWHCSDATQKHSQSPDCHRHRCTFFISLENLKRQHSTDRFGMLHRSTRHFYDSFVILSIIIIVVVFVVVTPSLFAFIGSTCRKNRRKKFEQKTWKRNIVFCSSVAFVQFSTFLPNKCCFDDGRGWSFLAQAKDGEEWSSTYNILKIAYVLMSFFWLQNSFAPFRIASIYNCTLRDTA